MSHTRAGMNNGKRRSCAAGYASMQITHESEVCDSGLPRQTYNSFGTNKSNLPQSYHLGNRRWLLTPQVIKPTGTLFQQRHNRQDLSLLTGQVWNEVKILQKSRQVWNFLQFSLRQFELKRKEDSILTPAQTLKQGMENAAANCSFLMYQEQSRVILKTQWGRYGSQSIDGETETPEIRNTAWSNSY